MLAVSLYAILSHLDWSCRTNKTALVKNMEVIVRDMGRLSQVDITPSSPLFKAANKLYNMTKMKKNVRKGKDSFMESEREILEKYEVKLEEQSEDESEEEEEIESEEKLKRRRRKNFEDLKSRTSKKSRVDNIIKVIKEDVGLDKVVVDQLKETKEDHDDSSEDEEAFKLCCLNLMKTVSLSETKYDDLRWWILDIIKRGFNLSKMPGSKGLRKKVKKEMVPPDMSTSETGAEFDISAALFHTGKRFLERPDIKQHLKDGDTLQHLAKVGADFATGFGKVQQVKESDFDEDGSHNTGFQTLKLSCGKATLFANKAPGGSELLRLVSKSTQKDTVEKMVNEMESLDKLCQEVPKQDVHVPGVGLIHVEHRLVNSLHDGKERLAMTQHKVCIIKFGSAQCPCTFSVAGETVLRPGDSKETNRIW